MILKYVVDEDSDKKTVKYILKNKLKISERLIKRLKYNQKILCNSLPVYINSTVKAGDVVEAVIDFEENNEGIIPEKINLDIIYEDEALIAVNKKPNMVVHPSAKHFAGTVANGLMYYLKEKGINTLIRPVSRLDRDTSGIIVFACNQYIQESLIRQMNKRIFKKTYLGIVSGIITQEKGTIDLPIARKPGSIMLRHISNEGLPSVTHFRVIERLNNASLLEFNLETGRTHQIRVHCQAIGHPLIGDTLYGGNISNIAQRQCLHSYKSSFIHPLTGSLISLTAPIPDDILSVLEILRK